mmetsp:Transcript_414/g.1107  ORF Transcript_414/g.1107 Transcript_414/m.1107 type:complete len:99 (+) Transcript_414:244-540(+)
MRVLNLLLLCLGATTALVYHPSSLLQHRGTHVLLSSEADEADADEAPAAADPPAPAAAADGGGVDGKLVVQGAAVAAMGAALYFLNTLPGPTSGWAAK